MYANVSIVLSMVWCSLSLQALLVVTCGKTDLQIWISSTFDVSQDVKDCIFRAADSVSLKNIPSYEVEMHDHTDWIKQSQVRSTPPIQSRRLLIFFCRICFDLGPYRFSDV